MSYHNNSNNTGSGGGSGGGGGGGGGGPPHHTHPQAYGGHHTHTHTHAHAQSHHQSGGNYASGAASATGGGGGTTGSIGGPYPPQQQQQNMQPPPPQYHQPAHTYAPQPHAYTQQQQPQQQPPPAAAAQYGHSSQPSQPPQHHTSLQLSGSSHHHSSHTHYDGGGSSGSGSGGSSGGGAAASVASVTSAPISGGGHHSHVGGGGGGGGGGYHHASESGGDEFEAKLRVDNAPSSKVLHIRGTPPGVNENELLALCSPFGNVVKTLILHPKQQAFVQMETVLAAAAIVKTYLASPACIRMKPVFFQFSNRDEIKTNPSAQLPHSSASIVHHAPQHPTAHSNQPQQFFHSGQHSHSHSHSGSTSNSNASSLSGTPLFGSAPTPTGDVPSTHLGSGGADLKTTTMPSAILLVTVLNTRDTVVTVHHLHTIFTRYGEVLKVVTFVKQKLLKALVELGSVDSAIAAKAGLEGKHMFQDSCRLRIGFSQLPELKILRNSARSKDFTLNSGIPSASPFAASATPTSNPSAITAALPPTAAAGTHAPYQQQSQQSSQQQSSHYQQPPPQSQQSQAYGQQPLTATYHPNQHQPIHNQLMSVQSSQQSTQQQQPSYQPQHHASGAAAPQVPDSYQQPYSPAAAAFSRPTPLSVSPFATQSGGNGGGQVNVPQQIQSPPPQSPLPVHSQQQSFNRFAAAAAPSHALPQPQQSAAAIMMHQPHQSQGFIETPQQSPMQHHRAVYHPQQQHQPQSGYSSPAAVYHQLSPQAGYQHQQQHQQQQQSLTPTQQSQPAQAQYSSPQHQHQLSPQIYQPPVSVQPTTPQQSHAGAQHPLQQPYQVSGAGNGGNGNGGGQQYVNSPQMYQQQLLQQQQQSNNSPVQQQLPPAVLAHQQQQQLLAHQQHQHQLQLAAQQQQQLLAQQAAAAAAAQAQYQQYGSPSTPNRRSSRHPNGSGDYFKHKYKPHQPQPQPHQLQPYAAYQAAGMMPPQVPNGSSGSLQHVAASGPPSAGSSVPSTPLQHQSQPPSPAVGGLGMTLGMGLAMGPPSSSPQAAAAFAAGGPGCVLIVNKLPPQLAHPDQLFTLFGVYGDVVRVKILFKRNDTAFVQFATPQQAHVAMMHLNRISLHGHELSLSVSKYNDIAMPHPQLSNNTNPNGDTVSAGSGGSNGSSPAGVVSQSAVVVSPTPTATAASGTTATAAASASTASTGSGSGSQPATPNSTAAGAVVVTTPAATSTPAAPGSGAAAAAVAMIRSASSTAASEGSASDHSSVPASPNLGIPLSPGTAATANSLTKDYSTSKIHRFTRAGRNARNINPPSRVLHVSNLPEGANEGQIKRMFGIEMKYAEPAVQFFQNNRKQCFVRMASIQEATLALIARHNMKFGDRYLRVSYSSRDASQVSDQKDATASAATAASGTTAAGPVIVGTFAGGTGMGRAPIPTSTGGDRDTKSGGSSAVNSANTTPQSGVTASVATVVVTTAPAGASPSVSPLVVVTPAPQVADKPAVSAAPATVAVPATAAAAATKAATTATTASAAAAAPNSGAAAVSGASSSAAAAVTPAVAPVVAQVVTTAPPQAQAQPQPQLQVQVPAAGRGSSLPVPTSKQKHVLSRLLATAVNASTSGSSVTSPTGAMGGSSGGSATSPISGTANSPRDETTTDDAADDAAAAAPAQVDGTASVPASE